ncbi:MAG TPA: hypothetical protein VGE52_17445 [Pirellulales bacterium]
MATRTHFARHARNSRQACALTVALLVGAWFSATCAEAAEPTLRLVRDESGRITRVEAIGLPRSLVQRLAEDNALRAKSLTVVTEDGADAGGTSRPAMAGTHKVQGETTLSFTPQFAFRAGMKYRAAFAWLNGPQAALDFEIPPPPQTEPAQVAALYPSAAELPENQLRFYLHFTAPMSRGEVYERVQLLDAKGVALELPFLELGEELWDATGTRVTLLMDPARIKKGLRPREEQGPSLRAGEAYTLVVDAGWPDANGRPLGEGFSKAFRVGPPIERALDAAEWKLTVPRIGTQEAVSVAFPRPVDHALLQRTLMVLDASGETVAGRATIADSERRWEFTPDRPWTQGAHAVLVEPVLEDLAGNRVGVPFEQRSQPREGVAIDDPNNPDAAFDPAVAKPTRLTFEPAAGFNGK